MSLEMYYYIDRAEFSMPVRDDEVFTILAKKYPQETDAVFGLDEPDGIHDPIGIISRVDILAAVDKLLTSFKQDSDLNPRRYVFDYDIIPGLLTTGGKEVRGMKLPGKDGFYCLFGGIDQCVIKERVTIPDNLFFEYQNTLDVRDKTIIETTSHGPIKIRSTKKRSPIAGDLKRLSQFLKSQSGEKVTKRLL